MTTSTVLASHHGLHDLLREAAHASVARHATFRPIAALLRHVAEHLDP